MKMVKSLLLGSATALVAIAGAQAADLPVKAKPVQYVKICSLYGAGFYYIPGTDMCLKIGGWVRAQYMFGIEDGTVGPLVQGNAAVATGAAAGHGNTGSYNRLSDDGFDWRARGYITADARHQSSYGTVRAYIAVGRSGDMGGAFNANRAFIQFAGFTFGLASSFYDFYSGPAVSFYGGQINPASDTGDGGNWVGAYTHQFGNGLSATIAAEDDRANRATWIWNPLVANPAAAVLATANQYAAPNWPDIVGNLRVEQSWGAAQIMGAIHNVAAGYNSASALALGMSTHAGDQTGYALGAGIKLFAPMIGKGDYFQAQVNYTQGALGYVFAGAGGAANMGSFRDGGTFGYGFKDDAIVVGGVTTSSLELTTAWGVNASYEHFWNDQWKTSLYGTYDEVSFSAVANAAMCAGMSGAGAVMAGTAGNPLCNNDWSYWTIGSRTQWNVTKAFHMGVDVLYSHLNTASGGMTGLMTPAAAFGQPSGVRTMSDQEAWIGYFRVHYDFYP
jgi:hypothetical protein